MAEVPKFTLPRPFVFARPSQDRLKFEKAHIEGRLIFESCDFPHIHFREVEADRR